MRAVTRFDRLQLKVNRIVAKKQLRETILMIICDNTTYSNIVARIRKSVWSTLNEFNKYDLMSNEAFKVKTPHNLMYILHYAWIPF